MEEISPEEMMGHAPDASRGLASHLRVGVLSLPGVEEACFAEPAKGAYFEAFSFDDDLVLRAHMEDPLRVTLELRERDAKAFLDRPDLANAGFQAAGETDPRPLADLIEAAQGPSGSAASVDLVVTSQEDLRAVVRLAHAKYDALMTG
ncbi:MAG: hypothetical protein ACE5I4_06470 [Thermoplasmata archaeon]